VDSKKKSPNDIKEKKKSDEPPKHPGFILQAKKSKEYKVCLLCYNSNMVLLVADEILLNDFYLQLRSTSLSLDGLLDYTANDTEESVFEVHILLWLL
jgi:hypothetical protein